MGYTQKIFKNNLTKTKTTRSQTRLQKKMPFLTIRFLPKT